MTLQPDQYWLKTRGLPWLLLGSIAFLMLLEGVFLLPVPFGDPVLFLASAKNHCETGFFGTSLYPLDPTGQHRYVWHGILSPLLHSALSPSCSLVGFYLVSFWIKAVSAWLTWQIGRHYRWAPSVTTAGVLLVLAAQSQIGFRPETLAVGIMLGVELALLRQRQSIALALIAALAWTQPTVFGLYVIFNVLVRTPVMVAMLSWRPLVSSVAVSALMVAIYPFPVVDLFYGIISQAQINAGRGDESGLWTFYVFTHFMPFWILPFIVALAWLTWRRPLLVLMWPAIWWFGPRVPPTNYNLIALLPILSLCALAAGNAMTGVRIKTLLSILLYTVGLLGLSQLFLRDALTLVNVGNGVEEARALINNDLEASDARVAHADGITHLLVGADRLEEAAQRKAPRELSYHQVSGMPDNPCAEQIPNVEGLSMFGKKIFNTTSGWQVYRCES